jgi:hypothetical protein
MSTFLPEGYEAPKTSANYLKFEEGENKFRILNSPIVGWIDWKDNKPLRFPIDKKPSAAIDPTKPIKHFWALPVWDYKSKTISILEITQKSIQAEITILSKDEEWGNPTGYDIKVIRKGSGLETEYTLNPVPPKALHEKIVELFKNTPLNMQALFEGKDPFEATDTKKTVSSRNDGLPNDFNDVEGAEDLEDIPF